MIRYNFLSFSENGTWFCRSSPRTRSQRCFLMLFAKIFIVSYFTFKFMIHFELIFEYSVRIRSKLFFCLWIFNCSSTIKKKSSLPPLSYFCTFIRNHLGVCVVLFLGSVFCSIDQSLSSPITHCLNCCSYIVSHSLRFLSLSSSLAKLF